MIGIFVKVLGETLMRESLLVEFFLKESTVVEEYFAKTGCFTWEGIVWCIQ